MKLFNFLLDVVMEWTFAGCSVLRGDQGGASVLFWVLTRLGCHPGTFLR
jgi:hypothetical protein